MKLTYNSRPYVGLMFVVVADDFRGVAVLEIRVWNRVVDRKECPDPPCHGSYLVQQIDRGSILEVEARDSSGAQERLSFIVGDEPERSPARAYAG
jgi:hypothetical protein